MCDRCQTPSTTSPTSATSSCSRRARGEPGLLPGRDGDGGRGARRAVGLPARLGRLPALQPQAHRAPRAGHRATWRCATWSPEALERRVAAIEARASARAGSTATSATAPPTGSPTRRPPDGALLRDRDATSPPEDLRPALKNQPQRYTGARRRGQAARPRQRALPGRRRQPRRSPTTCSASASTSATCSTTGRETGAWISLTIAAHELIYVARRPPRCAGGCTTSRSGSTRARSAARGRHLPRQRRADRGGAVQARRRAGLLPLRLRAGRQPRRGHHRRLLRLRPRVRADGLDRGRARKGRPGACSCRSRSAPTARRWPSRRDLVHLRTMCAGAWSRREPRGPPPPRRRPT